MSTNSNDIAGRAPGTHAVSAESAEAHYARGRSLILSGDLRRGRVHLQRALVLKPDFAQPRLLWGQLLLQRGEYTGALDSFRAAAAVDPRCTDAHMGVGTVLALSGKPGAAVASLDAAIALSPHQFRAHLLRGWVLRECGRLEEAAASLETVLRLQPGVPQAFAEALLCYAWTCDWAGVERMAQGLRRTPRGIENTEPSILLAFSDDPAEHAVAARGQAMRVAAGRRPLSPPPRYVHGPIRVAYVSRDFYAHATAYLMAELFELHSRAQFKVIGLSYGGDDGSAIRKRIASACDLFVEMGASSDEEIASWLREQEADIAVDLKGFTGYARPGIFALRPAAIQVNYLGHPGTLGAGFIDYIVADEFLIPNESRGFYAEKIAYLPDSYQVNDRKRAVTDRMPTRTEAGLPESSLVFCCFNNDWKITAPVFDVWMRLLKAVDGSVLWLLGDNQRAIENLRHEALCRDVAPERLIFARRVSNEDHLARHCLADVFLDTLPCNAHTSASDALWSGVPVVTCAGRSFPARVAGSLLRAVGLQELVAGSLEDYEALALGLARDRKRLAAIKDRLLRDREGLPLFDTPLFCRHLEQAYGRMCATYRAGKLPATFHVHDGGSAGRRP